MDFMPYDGRLDKGRVEACSFQRSMENHIAQQRYSHFLTAHAYQANAHH